MQKLSLDEGRFLVKLARRSIEEYLRGREPEVPKPPSEKLGEKRGVFVTLSTYPGKGLRGCIGFPLPTNPLVEATVRAAVSSATQDPRFPPVRLEEMDEIIVEVSVLTPPEEISYSDPRELPKKIVIGRDGLIIQAGGFSGLLLPQVPVEYNWSPEEYLMHLCLKAGLPSTYWLTGKAKLMRFTAQIFVEKEPRGEIVEEELKPRR